VSEDGTKRTYVGSTDTTVLDLDIDVVVFESLGLELDDFEVVPLFGIMDTSNVHTSQHTSYLPNMRKLTRNL
jgi:hypothetical protein